MTTSYSSGNSIQPKRESKFYVRSNSPKASDRIVGTSGVVSSAPVAGSMRIDGSDPVYSFLPSKMPPAIPNDKVLEEGDSFEQFLYDISIISQVPFVI